MTLVKYVAPFLLFLCVATAVEAGAPYHRILGTGLSAQTGDVGSISMDGEPIPASAAASLAKDMAALYQAALKPLAPRYVDQSTWGKKSIEIFPIRIQHKEERLALGGDIFLMSDRGMDNTLAFLREHDPAISDAMGVVFDTSMVEEHFAGEVNVTVLLNNVRTPGYIFHAIPGPDEKLGLQKELPKAVNRINVASVMKRVILIIPLLRPEKPQSDLIFNPDIALGEMGFHHAKGPIGLHLEGGVPSVDSARMIGTSIVDTGQGYLIHYNGWWKNGSEAPVHLGVLKCDYAFSCERVHVRDHMPERLGQNAFILPGAITPDIAKNDSFAVLSAYAVKTNGGFRIFYSGDARPWKHSVGYVDSPDGIHPQNRYFPVFSPTGAYEQDAGIHTPLILPAAGGGGENVLQRHGETGW